MNRLLLSILLVTSMTSASFANTAAKAPSSKPHPIHTAATGAVDGMRGYLAGSSLTRIVHCVGMFERDFINPVEYQHSLVTSVKMFLVSGFLFSVSNHLKTLGDLPNELLTRIHRKSAFVGAMVAHSFWSVMAYRRGMWDGHTTTMSIGVGALLGTLIVAKI